MALPKEIEIFIKQIDYNEYFIEDETIEQDAVKDRKDENIEEAIEGEDDIDNEESFLILDAS